MFDKVLCKKYKEKIITFHVIITALPLRQQYAIIRFLQCGCCMALLGLAYIVYLLYAATGIVFTLGVVVVAYVVAPLVKIVTRRILYWAVEAPIAVCPLSKK